MHRILILIFIFQSFSLWAKEAIVDYGVKIIVLETGDINVTENIKVIVENRKINHGIYRDAPTVYYGNFLSHNNSDIVILNVTLDGKEVDYKTENLINGIRIYIGSKHYSVSKGEHTYQIQYLAKNQIVVKDSKEEIYWNVTGNFWSFPINHASVSIYLPNNNTSTMSDYHAWTGKQGKKQQNYQAELFPEYLYFQTNMPLKPFEGFTIKASWSQGLVTNSSDPIIKFFKQNIFWFLSIVALLWFPIFTFIAWKKLGIDPPKGAIFPQYKAPNELSPAATRYILHKYYSSECFSVALMNMAYKGYLSIEQLEDDEYILKKKYKAGNNRLSNGEKTLLSNLFGSNKKQIKISETYNAQIKIANKELNKSLKFEYKDKCYRNNIHAIIVGVLISLLALFFSWAHFFNFSNYASSNLFISAAAIIGSVVALHIIRKPVKKLIAVIIPLFVLLMALINEGNTVYVAYIFIVFAIIAINALFYYLVQSPTIFGRKLLDKIAGFKMYLETAEKDRMELMNPPEMTPQLFEQFLPYALALGVENSWSKQFNQAMKTQGTSIDDYQPDWYVGTNFNNFEMSSVATAINSGLASSVASASIPPSSSSGSGGFSGGGGGGGGGGW